MKHIGLLTFHDTTNFGALLQTFGLYKKLNGLGYDCSIIDYQCANIVKREVPNRFKFSLNPKKLALELLVKSKYRRRYAQMHSFIKTNMPKITQSYDRQSVFNIKEDFDAYVVGSDMLWGLDITDGDYSYFLDFAQEEKTLFSYATSIGKRDWTDDEKTKIGFLLSRFKSISVRENVTVQRLLPVLRGKECHVVCDPTMLLSYREWMEFVSDRYKNRNYVLLYFDSDDGKAVADAKTYAKAIKKELLIVDAMPSLATGTHNVFPSKLEDFLSLIYYADTVFTASYHGLLFSLYFQKNFVYYNRTPAYRMETVAERFNIKNREGNRVSFNDMQPIDFDEIEKRLNEYRLESTRFIVNTLK